MARAASTNSFSRSERNSPRTSRASDVQMSIESTTARKNGPLFAERWPTTAATMSSGMVSRRSVKRMMTLSVAPP